MPSIAGRVLRGVPESTFVEYVRVPCFSALHRGQGPAGFRPGRCVGGAAAVSVPSIAGRVLRVVRAFTGATRPGCMFQCPPSRAGSCGGAECCGNTTTGKEFQCPPSRAGSCGTLKPSARRGSGRVVSVPSIAGRVLRDHDRNRALSGVRHQFQCPPSRAGSCGSTTSNAAPSEAHTGEVSVPSIAGRVLRGPPASPRRPASTSRFSALHRGQGPAGGPLRTTPRRLLSCCFSALHRGQGPAGIMNLISERLSPRFSALHRGQGPAGLCGAAIIG